MDTLSWTRRDVIKAAGVAGAGPIMSGAISMQGGQAAVPQLGSDKARSEPARFLIAPV
jgi:hypothetical protein